MTSKQEVCLVYYPEVGPEQKANSLTGMDVRRGGN